MQEFEKEMMQNFDIVINYYKNINSKKANTYADFKKEYFAKVKAFEILPKREKDRIQNLEDLIISEMEHIEKVKNNDKQ